MGGVSRIGKILRHVEESCKFESRFNFCDTLIHPISFPFHFKTSRIGRDIK